MTRGDVLHLGSFQLPTGVFGRLPAMTAVTPAFQNPTSTKEISNSEVVKADVPGNIRTVFGKLPRRVITL